MCGKNAMGELPGSITDGQRKLSQIKVNHV